MRRVPSAVATRKRRWRQIGNAIWLVAVGAGLSWLLLAVTVIGFPLLVGVVAAAAVWIVLELAFTYRSARRDQ